MRDWANRVGPSGSYRGTHAFLYLANELNEYNTTHASAVQAQDPDGRQVRFGTAAAALGRLLQNTNRLFWSRAYG